MSARQLFPQNPFAALAFADRKGVLSTEHSPRINHVLGALPRETYERLVPLLELVSLPAGWILYEAGARQKYMYFITGGLVSQFYTTANGETATFTVIGSEGATGIELFLGGETTPSQAMVLSSGYAYRLHADLLKSAVESHGSLRRLLLRQTHIQMMQTMQTAACTRHHSVQQQLCRWILSCLDRLPSNALPMTQEVIASALGVRRESVTEAVAKLKEASLIRCGRGNITVLDRPGLEAQACECYAVVKREYDRVRQPESTVATARTGGMCLPHPADWGVVFSKPLTRVSPQASGLPQKTDKQTLNA